MHVWLESFGASLLLAAAGGASCAADDLDVQAQRSGDSIEIRAHAAIAATPDLVWEVISDYGRLPEFVPGLKKSRILERNGNRAQVEQEGEARFLIFSFPIRVRLDIVEHPVEWISTRAIGGNVRSMVARYDIELERTQGRVTLRYTGTIEPDFELPPLVGMWALRSTFKSQFGAMVREIERRAASGGRRP